MHGDGMKANQILHEPSPCMHDLGPGAIVLLKLMCGC
jgi:hypothetical protein